MINPLEMLKNMENIKAQAEEMKNKAASMKATGYAMGNMIEVVVTGKLEVESIKIDPSMLQVQNAQMLEVFVASAVNNAMENIKTRMAQEFGQMGQQMGLTL